MAGARARGVRKWEAFAGRNRFWCGGRLMTAPQPGFLLLTLVLIAGTCALHFAFDSPYLATRVSPAVPAAGAALTALTLAALLRTALADPGIIPRASALEAAALGAATGSGGDPRPPPRALDVLVRGRPVKLKYCFTCKMFRPPRASHCSVCDNCVDRFDHHCPWVGNCVGRRNYRHFYTFVVSLSFLAVFVLGCAAAHLALAARGNGLAKALQDSPASALVAAMCFLAVWSVLGLAGFHTYLAATDQTTNEDIKGSWSGGRGAGGNPYSRGNACANCWHVLCGPLPPSLIDRRGPLPEPRDALPPTLQLPVIAVPPPPITPAPRPLDAGGGGGGGSGGGGGGYTNRSLEPDAHTHTHTPPHAHPLTELRVGTGGLGAAGLGAGGGALSLSRLRLLHDTTMIDAALDLDEPEPPLHLPPLVPPRSSPSAAPPRAL